MKDSDGPHLASPYSKRVFTSGKGKGIYLLVAIGSLLTVIGGSLFALYLQSLISRR